MLNAWLLTLILTQGRVFNFIDERWTFATQPGIELTRGSFSLTSSLAFDRNGYFGSDIGAGTSHDVTKRLTLTTQITLYTYPGYTPELTFSVEGRWKIH